MDGNGKMEIVRYTVWRDLLTEKFIVSVSKPNKRIKALKQYPFAYKVQRSFCGEMKEEIINNLKDDCEVVFI